MIREPARSDGKHHLGPHEHQEQHKIRPENRCVKEVAADPDPLREIWQAGEKYTFLKKSANKLMREGKKKNVRYVFLEPGDPLID